MASVSDEVAFSLPRPSLRDEINPTLIAPPELTSAITGHSPDTLTRTGPFMRSNAPPGRSRFILLGIAGALLMAVGGTAALAVYAAAADAPHTLAKNLAVHADVSSIERRAGADTPPIRFPAHDPESKPAGSPPVHVAARQGSGHHTPRLQPKQEPAEATPPPPVGSGNPFDRRH
jgi:hypothetical protein